MKCENCSSKVKPEVAFKASAIDCVGGFFLVFLLAIPVFFISWGVTNWLFSVIEVLGKQGDASFFQRLIVLESVAQIVVFVGLYYLGLYKYGLKALKYASLFINYKLKIAYSCNACGAGKIICNLPNHENV